MFAVGLTGGIGSGKSTVANLFIQLGAKVISADAISRELTATNSANHNLILRHFGNRVTHEDGTLNRHKLKELIFTDANEKLWLENLLHPQIRAIMREKILNATAPYVILDIPLLFETAKSPLVNRVLVVDCPVEDQIKRVMARDKVSPQFIQTIIQQQTPREFRLNNADDVIDNSGSMENTAAAVRALHEQYQQLSKEKSF